MYQRAMRELPAINSNRLSVASFDTTTTSLSPNPAGRLSPPSSPSPSAAPSTASALKDTWHSTASNLRAKMGRSSNSAQGDRARPVVSGPLPSSPVPDEATPSFGTVSHYFPYCSRNLLLTVSPHSHGPAWLTPRRSRTCPTESGNARRASLNSLRPSKLTSRACSSSSRYA